MPDSEQLSGESDFYPRGYEWMCVEHWALHVGHCD